MHQRIRQCPIGREKKQTSCRQIQPPDRHPAGALQLRQGIEYKFPALWVLATRNFVAGLVVEDMAMRMGSVLQRQRTPVERDSLASLDRFAELHVTAVDLESPFPDPGFDFTT